MKVLYDDDLASHIAPEPCVVVREDGVEASAGERAGWPSSRESRIPSADDVTKSEGNTDLRVNASGGPARRGQRPQHARTLLAREPGGLLSVRWRSAPPDRTGKAGRP